MKNGIKEAIARCYSPLLVLALWELLSRGGGLDPRFFPPPTAIFAGIALFYSRGTLLSDVGITMFRIVCGLALGGLPALFCGVLMARSRAFYRFLHPLAALTYPVPKVAVIPFIILLLGMGELSKISVVATGAFFLVLFNTYHGVAGIDKIYFEIAGIYSYSRLDRWRYIILPGALPSIFNGLRLASATCFIMVVAAEFLGSASGIGYRVWISWETFQITQMFAGLFVLSFLGWALNAFWEAAEKAALPWKNFNRAV